MQWISAFEFRFTNRNKAIFSTSEYTDLLMDKLAHFPSQTLSHLLTPFVVQVTQEYIREVPRKNAEG